MKHLTRLRPSPAMVVACIALTIALGGTSYAAIKLPKNSVGTKQLKRNAVTSPKVKNNAITGADVNEASLATVPAATNATNATNAGNANTLGGIAASGFLLSTRDGGGALAGANITQGGTVNAFFNRFGGAPTVAHTAGTGSYTLTFPGLEGRLFNSTVVHIATLVSTGEIRASSSGGNPVVLTYDSAGAAGDSAFYYTVFGTNAGP